MHACRPRKLLKSGGQTTVYPYCGLGADSPSAVHGAPAAEGFSVFESSSVSIVS